jgi:HSP20 family protein
MIRRRIYPVYSLWNEIDELMNMMENRLAESFSGENFFSSRIRPVISGECRVDVVDHDDVTYVVADLPGADKDNVRIKLIDPKTLEISCNREKNIEKEDEEKGYYLRERTYGEMIRHVSLPVEVSEEGATASFNNGVLEVHLKKIALGTGKDIEIK